MLGSLLNMALAPVLDAAELAEGVVTLDSKKVAKAGTRIAVDAAIGFAAGKAIESVLRNNGDGLMGEVDIF